MSVSEVTESNFDAEVLQSKTPVVVDIWATWCGPCVPPETVILGDNKPISDFNIGDHTFSLTGHREVTRTFERAYNDEILEVRANGLLPFQITPDHPVLVTTSRSTDRIIGFSKPYWKEAGDLVPKEDMKDGDYLIMPKMKGTLSVKKLSLMPYINQNSVKMARAKHVPLSFDLNTDTAWLLGLYAAEGNESDNVLVFNLGAHEKGLQDKIILIGKNLGYSPCKNTPTQGAIKVSIKSRVLKRAFTQWCGRLAPNKKIPDFIMLHKNEKILKAFIDGYMAGDGSRVGNTQSAKPVSKLLLMQLQLLYARFGIFSTLQLVTKAGTSKIPGRTVKIHDTYVLNVPLSGKSQSKQKGKYFFVPIREVKHAPYHGTVCNLETKDNTYLVNNIVVHNCRMYSPIIDDASKDYEGKIKFVKIDADENQNIATKYNVMSIPTTLLIKDGKVKAMQVGAVPKDTLKKWIDKNL
jgi:thioredoxin